MDNQYITREELAHTCETLVYLRKEMQKQIQELQEYVDTVSSPLYKRIYWWFCGYYFRKVVRWY
jgi:hypothetical protein